ncbi:hypothetical protein HYX11_05195 [Candidatus Woesearchaeota archaeon]|nr:hypothetical protein [Candidatus Woesearchaeota archaeon]
MKLVLSLLIGTLGAISLVSAVDPSACPGLGYGGYGMMGMMAGYGGYGAGMLLSWVLYLAILALIIAGIYWLVTSANKKNK